uniref:MSP domain-containing protein n=1 Tax=Heterorhabditis bacteriophora TaxID=37862 RepID=A0A1I7WLK2_HETBA
MMYVLGCFKATAIIKHSSSYYFLCIRIVIFQGDRSDYPHVVSIFDIRKGTEPVITLKVSKQIFCIGVKILGICRSYSHFYEFLLNFRNM